MSLAVVERQEPLQQAEHDALGLKAGRLLGGPLLCHLLGARTSNEEKSKLKGASRAHVPRAIPRKVALPSARAANFLHSPRPPPRRCAAWP